MSDDPRYPVGEYMKPAAIGPEERKTYLDVLEAAPGRLREAVRDLDDARLDTPYRDGGWTVRQVVHHVPDSHMNAYVRFKLALTEDRPLICAYNEAAWAALADASTGPIDVSLALLEAIHYRWTTAARSLPSSAFERQFRHPSLGLVSLNEQIAHYAWHSRHHVAHITSLRRRKGWT